MEELFSQVAVMIGDPVRAKILWALLDGRAYTASELAVFTDTSAQNISMHLNKLVRGELLSVQKQGRHRYYNYARPDISHAIEAMANLIPGNSIRKLSRTEYKPVEYCRTCYDHLAGRAGVLVTEGLLRKGYLVQDGDGYEVSAKGRKWLTLLEIDLDLVKEQKRNFAKACLDWSERRHHLAGALGAALLDAMMDNGWLRRTANSRAVVITSKGSKAFQQHLGVNV